MIEASFYAVLVETVQHTGGSDGTTLVPMVSYGIQRTRRPLWHLQEEKLKLTWGSTAFHFLLWLLSGKAELFGGFERIIWMWDIKKNREVFMHLHGEILLLLLWVSYHGCSKGKESDCFLETDFLFTVKELRDGNFHLSVSYHQREECDNMQSFVRVSVIISRQPVRDQWIILNY